MTDKAILAVSFGTTHDDTRARTIDRLESALAQAFPHRKLYRAWTSGMVRKRLATPVDSVSEAMSRLARYGIRDLLVQPTHVLDGVENNLMRHDLVPHVSEFDAVRLGDPLLANDDDLRDLAAIIAHEFADVPDDEALILMGHGTSHPANAMYAALDYRLRDTGHGHMLVATVEGYPPLESAIKRLRELPGVRKVVLAPLMIVAGDHAKNDMAGDQPDSWRNVLAAQGYEVRCLLRGLGEWQPVIDMLVDHARCAERGKPL